MLDLERRVKVVEERMTDHRQLLTDIRQDLRQFEARVDARFAAVDARFTGIEARLTELGQKITVRARFLRHHRGALNILPYGQINRLRNTSRDWMIMILEFRLALETDLRKVKKIVKDHDPRTPADDDFLKNKIRNDVGQFLYSQTKRRPMVLPVVIKV